MRDANYEKILNKRSHYMIFSELKSLENSHSEWLNNYKKEKLLGIHRISDDMILHTNKYNLFIT